MKKQSFTVTFLLQLHCPIPSDQLSLLRLLSTEANQLFTYYPSSTSELSFVGANGDSFEANSEHVKIDKVSGAWETVFLAAPCLNGILFRL